MFWDTVLLTDEISLRKKVLMKRIQGQSRSKIQIKVEYLTLKIICLQKDHPPAYEINNLASVGPNLEIFFKNFSPARMDIRMS